MRRRCFTASAPSSRSSFKHPLSSHCHAAIRVAIGMAQQREVVLVVGKGELARAAGNGGRRGRQGVVLVVGRGASC